MSFPDLQLDPKAKYHAVAEGVPVNGNNSISLPFRKEIIDPDKLEVDVFSLGPSIHDATVISVDSQNRKMVINFNQVGLDRARVEVVIRHTICN